MKQTVYLIIGARGIVGCSAAYPVDKKKEKKIKQLSIKVTLGNEAFRGNMLEEWSSSSKPPQSLPLHILAAELVGHVSESGWN